MNNQPCWINNSNSNNQINSNNINLKINLLENKIQSLEKQVEVLSKNNTLRNNMFIIHNNIKCNNCMKKDISGIRYLCGNCNNYNLCDQCINFSNQIHPENHFFIRITNTNTWNQLNSNNFNV